MDEMPLLGHYYVSIISDNGECRVNGSDVLRVDCSSRLGHSSTEHARFRTGILVFRLSPADRNVLVLVHVHDLSFHCHEEQDEKVHEQYRPKDGNVKDGKEGHDNGGSRSPGASHPKFELWKSSGKRSVFFSFFCGRGQSRLVFIGLWVFQWRQKGDEVVQQKDSQAIRHNEISLHQVDS